MYVRGNGIRIAGATAAQADAFDFAYPYQFVWRHGVYLSEATGRSQQWRQVSLGIKDAGTVLLRFLGKPSKTPRLPVGTKLTSLTLTFASGQTVAIASGEPDGWAVISEATVEADKNGSPIEGTYRIHFSGPVTPDFGPDWL